MIKVIEIVSVFYKHQAIVQPVARPDSIKGHPKGNNDG
jgi:hypothetical protein